MKLGLLFSSFAAPALLAGALVACSSTDGTATAPPSTAPPPAPTAAPAPKPCGAGTHTLEDGTCEATLSIARSAQAVAPGRDHHVSIIAPTRSGPYLYVFGGTAGWRAMYGDVQRAKIATDGSLGAFEKVGQLPAGRAGHCGVFTNGTFYLVGGTVAGTAPGDKSMTISGTTLTARLADDGTIGAVAEGPRLPAGVMHATCDLNDGALYVVGGRGAAGRSVDQIARSRLGADGTFGAFEKLAPLTPDRSHHASFVRGGFLYVVGGLTGDPAGKLEEHADVIRAKIEPDGTLGAFSPAGKLGRTLSVSAAQLFNDQVYVFGGLTSGDAYTDAIQRASFAADGSVQEFVKAPVKLSVARAHVHQLPVFERYIYSIGGLDNDGESVGTVDIGTFE
jgi:hypothetical protein